MKHAEAKQLLKYHGLTIVRFADAVGVSDTWIRQQARNNGGEYTELYRLALHQFVREHGVRS